MGVETLISLYFSLHPLSSVNSTRNTEGLVTSKTAVAVALQVFVDYWNSNPASRLRRRDRGVQGGVSLRALPSEQTTYDRIFKGTSPGGFFLLKLLLCILTETSF